MKTCLCCATPAPDNAETCAKCGEGSWSASVAEKKSAPEAAADKRAAAPRKGK